MKIGVGRGMNRPLGSVGNSHDKLLLSASSSRKFTSNFLIRTLRLNRLALSPRSATKSKISSSLGLFAYLAFLVVIISVLSLPSFAITQIQCDSSCRTEYATQWTNQQGKCFADGQIQGTQYYNGNQIWSAFSTGLSCDSISGRPTSCYCVGYDSSYLSQNNLALNQVLSTSCEYTAANNQYTIVIEYLSLGMNTFTVQDTASNTFTQFLSGFQTDVRQLSRASVEQGQTGPSYQRTYRWSAPAIANLQTLFSRPGYPLNIVPTGQNQYQDIPITCNGPQTSSGIDIPALDGAKEIGIREVLCGGKQLPNKWNLVDLDVSTTENVSGSCDIVFDNSYAIYGVMIAGEPGVGISTISAGPVSISVNKAIPASGKIFIPMNTDQRGNPPKAGSLRVGFSGTGVVGEINPFPDLALISNLSVTPKELVIGDSVAIEGTVTKQLFSASGQYARCRAGFQSTCKVIDDSKFYIMPLPKIVFDFLTDSSIGFPMIKIPVWFPLDWRSGLAIAAMEGLILVGNKGSIEKIVASALLGYVIYDLNTNYVTYSADTEHAEKECISTGRDSSGKACKGTQGAKGDAGDCVFKCNVRIATIPWFAYHGEPNPGPKHYTFQTDTCVRPDASDLLMLNLPTYLAFGDYWAQERDKLDERARQQMSAAYERIPDCEGCIVKGVSYGNLIRCIDYTKTQCNEVNNGGQGPCSWKDGVCGSNPTRGHWCAETGDGYFVNKRIGQYDSSKEGLRSICVPADQQCPDSGAKEIKSDSGASTPATTSTASNNEYTLIDLNLVIFNDLKVNDIIVYTEIINDKNRADIISSIEKSNNYCIIKTQTGEQASAPCTAAVFDSNRPAINGPFMNVKEIRRSKTTLSGSAGYENPFTKSTISFSSDDSQNNFGNNRLSLAVATFSLVSNTIQRTNGVSKLEIILSGFNANERVSITISGTFQLQVDASGNLETYLTLNSETAGPYTAKLTRANGDVANRAFTIVDATTSTSAVVTTTIATKCNHIRTGKEGICKSYEEITNDESCDEQSDCSTKGGYCCSIPSNTNANAGTGSGACDGGITNTEIVKIKAEAQCAFKKDDKAGCQGVGYCNFCVGTNDETTCVPNTAYPDKDTKKNGGCPSGYLNDYKTGNSGCSSIKISSSSDDQNKKKCKITTGCNVCNIGTDQAKCYPVSLPTRCVNTIENGGFGGTPDPTGLISRGSPCGTATVKDRKINRYCLDSSQASFLNVENGYLASDKNMCEGNLVCGIPCAGGPSAAEYSDWVLKSQSQGGTNSNCVGQVVGGDKYCCPTAGVGNNQQQKQNANVAGSGSCGANIVQIADSFPKGVYTSSVCFDDKGHGTGQGSCTDFVGVVYKKASNNKIDLLAPVPSLATKAIAAGGKVVQGSNNFANDCSGITTISGTLSAQPGDILILKNCDHVGIYYGDGKIIHHSTSDSHIKVAPISDFNGQINSVIRMCGNVADLTGSVATTTSSGAPASPKTDVAAEDSPAAANTNTNTNGEVGTVVVEFDQPITGSVTLSSAYKKTKTLTNANSVTFENVPVDEEHTITIISSGATVTKSVPIGSIKKGGTYKHPKIKKSEIDSAKPKGKLVVNLGKSYSNTVVAVALNGKWVVSKRTDSNGIARFVLLPKTYLLAFVTGGKTIGLGSVNILSGKSITATIDSGFSQQTYKSEIYTFSYDSSSRSISLFGGKYPIGSNSRANMPFIIKYSGDQQAPYCEIIIKDISGNVVKNVFNKPGRYGPYYSTAVRMNCWVYKKLGYWQKLGSWNSVKSVVKVTLTGAAVGGGGGALIGSAAGPAGALVVGYTGGVLGSITGLTSGSLYVLVKSGTEDVYARELEFVGTEYYFYSDGVYKSKYVSYDVPSENSLALVPDEPSDSLDTITNLPDQVDTQLTYSDDYTLVGAELDYSDDDTTVASSNYYPSDLSGAFITPIGEQSVASSGSSPGGQFVRTITDGSTSDDVLIAENNIESQQSYATASTFANQCKSAVKRGKYFCVDSQVDGGNFFVKGVGTYDKNLETNIYLGNGVSCVYPYVTNEVVCDNVGKLVDDYYSKTGGAVSDKGYNTIDLCTQERFYDVDSLKALGVLENNVCPNEPSKQELRSNSPASVVRAEEPFVNKVSASGVDKNNNIQLISDKNNLITANAVSFDGVSSVDDLNRLSLALPKTTTTTNTNTGTRNAGSNTATDPYYKDPKSDNARMMLALLQMFTRQDKVKQAAGAGSGYYFREWKTKPSLKQPDCGNNDPVLGSGYPTSSGSSGSSNTYSSTGILGSSSASGVGSNTYSGGSPGGAVTVGGSPVGGNSIGGAATGLATGLAVARDNAYTSYASSSASQSYDTNSYSSDKSSQDKNSLSENSQNLITGNQVLPSGAGGIGSVGRPIGTVQKPFVESGPFSGLYHTTEGAVFSFQAPVYLTIFTANGTVANDCGPGSSSTVTSNTFNDSRIISTGASVNTDLGGVIYNVLLVNFTTSSTAIINVTSVDGSSVQTVSLGTSKSVLGLVVLMKSVANDTSSASFSFSRTQTSSPSLGAVGLCQDIPVATDSNGYFKYFYTPMTNQTYKAVVKVQSNGGGPEDQESGLVLQKQDVFNARPFTPPTISANMTERCSSPLASSTFIPSLVDKASFGITIQSSGNLSLPSAKYIFEMIEEPPSTQGDAGFEEYDSNGNIAFVNRKEIIVSAGQFAQVNLSSAMILPTGENSHTYIIRARVSNSTYNISKEFTFNHTVFKKLSPLLEVVSEPVKRPFDLRPEAYFIRVTNQNPAKCGSNNYFLLKEVPNLWSGKIEVDGETDLLALNAGANAETRFTLTPNPASTEIGKRYQANMIVTEGAPQVIQSLLGANDLMGIDTDIRSLYFIGPNRVAIFDKVNFTGQSFEANGGRAIVADSGIGGNIYWSEFSQNEGRIFCSSKTRFSGTRVVSQADASRLAVTDNYIYYTNKTAIFRAIKNCIAEQTKEVVYFTNTSKIIDIAGDGSTLYWLETSGNGSVDIRSVGESQIGVGGAIDIFTIATRDSLGSLYIAKGTGGIGSAGANGIYYSTNSTTSRIALLSSSSVSQSQNSDRIIVGGADLTSGASFADLALDNSTVYWIDNGVKRISKDNPVTYASVFYEYRPDSPLVTASPINISMSPGETKIFNINVTNKAYLPVSYGIKLDNIDSNFTGLFLGKGLNFNETFSPRETRGYLLSLTANSSTPVNTSFSICARAMNTTIWPSSGSDSAFSRCISILVGVRSRPTLSLNVIDARSIQNGSAKVLPADVIFYNLSITNNDGPDFGLGMFNITMAVPSGWNYFIDNNLLNISSLSRSSTRIRLETPANAIDGEYELSLNVSNKLDMSRTLTGLNPRVIIHMCGNSVCDLEKGEDNVKCPVDCPNPGFTDLGGVYNVPSWPALLQHDFAGSYSVNFSAFLAIALDRSLEQQKILSCSAGANISQCRAAQSIGGCGFGSSCLAFKNLTVSETIPVMEMRCPSDRTETYYLVYTGKKIINLTPTDIDFVSPNYTYSCPFYNTTGLRLIKASLEEKTSLCQQILFNYNNSVYAPPTGRTKNDCVASWTKICNLESSFLRYINLALDPAIISVENSRKAFELYSKLNNEVWFTDYHQCEGVVTLFIEDVRVR